LEELKLKESTTSLNRTFESFLAHSSSSNTEKDLEEKEEASILEQQQEIVEEAEAHEKKNQPLGSGTSISLIVMRSLY